MSEGDGMGNIAHTPLADSEREALRRHAAEVDWALGVLVESAVWNVERLETQLEGAVLAPEVAAVAATLVDLAKRSLPPHISEAQQVEAYLALRRIAGGQ